jgi:hypothetical protein
MEEEELLFLHDYCVVLWNGEYHSNFTMIPFRSFFEEMLILGHLLFIWKGDTIDSLERVILGVAKPVGS